MPHRKHHEHRECGCDCADVRRRVAELECLVSQLSTKIGEVQVAFNDAVTRVAQRDLEQDAKIKELQAIVDAQGGLGGFTQADLDGLDGLKTTAARLGNEAVPQPLTSPAVDPNRFDAFGHPLPASVLKVREAARVAEAKRVADAHKADTIKAEMRADTPVSRVPGTRFTDASGNHMIVNKDGNAVRE